MPWRLTTIRESESDGLSCPRWLAREFKAKVLGCFVTEGFPPKGRGKAGFPEISDSSQVFGAHAAGSFV